MFASVNVTMGWCKQKCPGIQHSDLRKWLQPLKTRIAPYIGLLLLSPIGGVKTKETKSKAKNNPEPGETKTKSKPNRRKRNSIPGWKHLKTHVFPITSSLCYGKHPLPKNIEGYFNFEQIQLYLHVKYCIPVYRSPYCTVDSCKCLKPYRTNNYARIVAFALHP
jgi:hypothetical protein